MKACILIKTSSGAHEAVAQQVAKLRGVKTAFSSIGRADVVVNTEVRDLKELSRVIMQVGKVQGLAASETLIQLEL